MRASTGTSLQETKELPVGHRAFTSIARLAGGYHIAIVVGTPARHGKTVLMLEGESAPPAVETAEVELLHLLPPPGTGFSNGRS